MKISAKLRASIMQQITEEGAEYRKLLDDQYRAFRISHDLWHKLHLAHILTESNTRVRVLATIANYHR